jgi:GNAT superfamily N-acetyltransferase
LLKNLKEKLKKRLKNKQVIPLTYSLTAVDNSIAVFLYIYFMQIQVSNSIKLEDISLINHGDLTDLMREIYPPMYHHLWEDKGEWYLKELYSKENLQKELLEENQEYYFVLYKEENIGILRMISNVDFNGIPDEKSIMLHRIYLHPKTQGKGLGKELLNWIENISKERKKETLWLKAMDTQEQALHFYQNSGFSIIKKTTLEFSLLYIHLRGMYVMSKNLVLRTS